MSKPWNNDQFPTSRIPLVTDRDPPGTYVQAADGTKYLVLLNRDGRRGGIRRIDPDLDGDKVALLDGLAPRRTWKDMLPKKKRGLPGLIQRVAKRIIRL